MEDTLREAAIARFGIIIKVLILVVMEDTLRVMLSKRRLRVQVVLILVVMEDTLREQDIRIFCRSGIGIYKTNSACSC